MDEIEVAIVVETTVPMQWTVEAINVDGDGGIARATFSGYESEKSARDYARWKYGVMSPNVVAA